jgi:CheY-like chemotaxis protein
MARAFADQSGGAFAIASKPGQGTTVTLWFPAAAQEPPKDPARAAGLASHGASHERTHILLVDDDSMVRGALAYVLEELGFTVAAVPSAAVAISHLDSNAPPDVVVTDYAMAGMNGIELIEALAARLPGLPTILLTGFADPEALARLDRIAGPRTALLRKPVTGEALADQIGHMLIKNAGRNRTGRESAGDPK